MSLFPSSTDHAAAVLDAKPLPRPLHVIARDIVRHWPNVNYAAKPYLGAMRYLNSTSDTYGEDSAYSVVAYFLSNATGWRGPEAKAIKAELNAMLKTFNKSRGR